MLAQSPKYPALYDVESGVLFSHGRAEVTEEQAIQLAERRFTDGILIEGQPAKHWARDRTRQEDAPEPLTDPGSESTSEAVPDERQGRRRKAT